MKRLVALLVFVAAATHAYSQADPSKWYTLDATVSNYMGGSWCLESANVTAYAGLLTETVTSGSYNCAGQATGHAAGAIVSTPFFFTYGTVKVVAKFAPTGVHSVLWLWGGAPGTSAYPPTCIASIKANTSAYQTACTADASTAYEIDFGEYMPSAVGVTSVNQYLHTWVNNVVSTPFGAPYNVGADLSQAFHTYEVDWLPSGITWKVDGVTTNSTVPTADTFDQPMYIIIDEWIDSFGGTGTYPLSTQVKSVQVFDQANALIFSDLFPGAPAFWFGIP